MNFQFYLDAGGLPQITRISLSAAANASTASLPSAIGIKKLIVRLIRWSSINRFLVLLATLMVGAWGVYSVMRTPFVALSWAVSAQVRAWMLMRRSREPRTGTAFWVEKNRTV